MIMIMMQTSCWTPWSSMLSCSVRWGYFLSFFSFFFLFFVLDEICVEFCLQIPHLNTRMPKSCEKQWYLLSVAGLQWGKRTRNGEVKCLQAHFQQQDFPTYHWVHCCLPVHHGPVFGQVCTHGSIKQGAMVDHSVNWIHELANSCNCEIDPCTRDQLWFFSSERTQWWTATFARQQQSPSSKFLSWRYGLRKKYVTPPTFCLC